MAAAVLLLPVQVHNHQVFRLHHPLGKGGGCAENNILPQANGDITVSPGHIAATVQHPADTADLLAYGAFAFQSHSPLFFSRVALALLNYTGICREIEGGSCTNIIQEVLISEFDFHLPEELIAQEPLASRSASRMLHLDRRTGEYHDRRFAEFPDLLRPDDLLVLNNSSVFPARLLGRRAGI